MKKFDIRHNFAFFHHHIDLLTILFLSTVFGQFAGLSYLPILPAIQNTFYLSSQNIVQLAMTFYLCGFIVPQLVAAHFSDFIGRRKIFLAGVFLATIAIFIGSTSVHLYMLFACLFFTAAGIGLITSINSAIVRDRFEERESAQIFGVVNLAIAIGGIIAPIFSGVVGMYFGWRWVFVFLSILGLMISIISYTQLKETHRAHDLSFSWYNIFHTALSLFGKRAYYISALNISFSSGALTGFNATIPFLLLNRLHFDAKVIGFAIVIPNITMVLGIVISGFYTHTLHRKMLMIGNAIMVAATFIFFAIALLDILNFLTIMAPVAIFGFGLGIVLPYCWSRGLHPFPHVTAVAAAYIVLIQNLVAIIVSLLVAYFPEKTAIPLSSLMLALSLLGAIDYFIF